MSSEITVRKATPEDGAAIYAINKEAMGYDFPAEKTNLRLKFILELPEHDIFIAVVDQIVVGYIHIQDYECVYGDGLKDILALAVNPDFHRMGIGKALITAAEKKAKDDGAVGMRLESGIERIGAHKFYESCGYTLRKEHKNYVKSFVL
jgi:ribosomal protein S18 acetylase RimI-like enzyme